MADALVSAVLGQLVSVMQQEIENEVRLVVGVEEQVQMLTSILEAIGALLTDAEKRQVHEEGVRLWLEKLKDVAYDAEDVLDEWRTAILQLQLGEKAETAPNVPRKKVCCKIPSPGFCFSRVVLRRDIALKIKDINGRLDAISKEKDRYSFIPKSTRVVAEEPARQRSASFVDVSRIKGRDLDKDVIVGKLLGESSQADKGPQLISLVGMGGMGKTTLAQLAYNDEAVMSHFEKKIWVCVSDPFDEVRIAHAILKALDEESGLKVGYASSLDWEGLPQRIHKSIMGKRFLLVLDDVWTEDYRKWEPLEHSLSDGGRGSRILVTTRSERVAKMMGSSCVHSLKALSDEECWLVFSQIAFFGRSKKDSEKLEKIGREIANKCKGLPLAAKTLGSLMRLKDNREDWQHVLGSEIWQLEVVEKHLSPALLLSYDDLSPAMKRCFSYCAIFPKDCEIERDNLIQLWMAQGFLGMEGSLEMERTGEDYFQNLAMRSFFQDFEKDSSGGIILCKMHDLVHDFAQFLTKNECVIVDANGKEQLKMDLSCGKARHLTVECEAMAPFRSSNYNTKKLRTLLLTFSRMFIAPCDPFDHMAFVRALDLSGNAIEVPLEVGRLIHLRYLNLSNNLFEVLPETLCNLCNLQTLNLNWCPDLKKLPQGIGNLVNLRHLQILKTESLRVLPKGIGGLISLRTLEGFCVGSGDDSEACKIGYLRNLNNLRGSLEISGLKNVVKAWEAEKAELKKKNGLHYLKLKFSGEGEDEIKDYEVLKALQPPPDLESLVISFYGGTRIPNWITSLTNLRGLNIKGCKNCACLPPLGILPSLELLIIQGMAILKKVGLEFLGIQIDDDDRQEKGADGTIVFPKLKELGFSGMDEWEEWDVGTRLGKEIDMKVMPCLTSLKVEDCPKLKALPRYLQLTTLKELDISGCPILEEDNLEEPSSEL
ncbi:putative disease resistance protein RGA3 [Malania oleifera]|uniref:putative disease resistance protein RGA3 n=1 Tax=Malania oleifera TaxID=397392 RepID=UPI0025AE0ED0|nr:putative disease resistance protein RGA3 [Malania oleifera]